MNLFKKATHYITDIFVEQDNMPSPSSSITSPDTQLESVEVNELHFERHFVEETLVEEIDDPNFIDEHISSTGTPDTPGTPISESINTSSKPQTPTKVEKLDQKQINATVLAQLAINTKQIQQLEKKVQLYKEKCMNTRYEHEYIIKQLHDDNKRLKTMLTYTFTSITYLTGLSVFLLLIKQKPNPMIEYQSQW